MSVFRYRDDILPVAIFTAFFAADLSVFFLVQSKLLVLIWTLIGVLPKSLVSSYNHHHQHVPTFRKVWMNRLIDFMYGLQTGISGHAWVLHHVVGHHQNYMDQDLDESRWRDAQGRKMGVVRYSLITALTAYPRCFEVGPHFPRLFRTFLLSGSAVVIALGILFYLNWFNALMIFAIPMWVSLYNTAWHTYYHHAGLDTEDEFEASYNIVEKWYNIATGNLGYHTAHHVKMGIHWSRLPEYHEKIRSKIPENLYRLPPPPFKWFIPKGVNPAELDRLHAEPLRDVA
jgi:fatty acid desaturase